MSESLNTTLQDALFTTGLMDIDDSDCPTFSLPIEDELRLIQQRDEYNNSILSEWIKEREETIHMLQPAEENVPYTIVEVPDDAGGKRYVFREHPGPGFDNW